MFLSQSVSLFEESLVNLLCAIFANLVRCFVHWLITGYIIKSWKDSVCSCYKSLLKEVLSCDSIIDRLHWPCVKSVISISNGDISWLGYIAAEIFL